MRYCRECGTDNYDDARFCRKCGYELEVLADAPAGHPSPEFDTRAMAGDGRSMQGGAAASGARGGGTPHRRRRVQVAVALVASALAVAWAVVFALPMLLPGGRALVSSNSALGRVDRGPSPIQLHLDRSQLLVGEKDSAALVNADISVPAGFDGETLELVDGDGHQISSIDVADMQPGDDGRLHIVLGLEIPTSEQDTFVLRVEDPRDNDEDNNGDNDEDNNGGNVGGSNGGDNGGDNDKNEEDERRSGGGDNEVIVPVSYRLSRSDVLEAAELASATAARIAQSGGATVDDVATWLEEDSRVGLVRVWGNAVYFSTKAGVLGTVDLSPVDPAALGGASEAYPGLDLLDVYDEHGEGAVLPDSVWTYGGNVATNGNVLLLEPTPDHIASSAVDAYQRQAQRLAEFMGGEESRRVGAEALRALLRGELTGQGTVLVHAHGTCVEEGGPVSLLAWAMDCGMDEGFSAISSELDSLLGEIEASALSYELTPLTEETGAYVLFSGDPTNVQGWRLSVYAAPASDGGTTVGIRSTTGLIRWWYSAATFDNTLIWLGTCEGLGDVAFDAWALGHGAQAVVGYHGSMGTRSDVANLSRLMDALTSPSEVDPTRTKTLAEVCLDYRGGRASLFDRTSEANLPCYVGNDDFHYKGSSTVEVHVGYDDESPAPGGVAVEMLRLWERTIERVDSREVDEDGKASFVDMPQGVYVVVVRNAQGEVVCKDTLVVDDPLEQGVQIVVPRQGDDPLDVPADEPSDDSVPPDDEPAFSPLEGLPFTYDIPAYWQGRVEQRMTTDWAETGERISVFIYPSGHPELSLVSYYYEQIPEGMEWGEGGDIGSHCIGIVSNDTEKVSVWTNNWPWIACYEVGSGQAYYETSITRETYEELVDLSTGGVLALEDVVVLDPWDYDNAAFWVEEDYSELEILPLVSLD